MSRRRKSPTTDPRKAGGSIAGPGGPHDRHGVVISAKDAVLLDDTYVAAVETEHDGQAMPPAIALQLSGRINQTDERASVLFLLDTDGAAAVISELLGVASRMSRTGLAPPDFLDRLLDRISQVPK